MGYGQELYEKVQKYELEHELNTYITKVKKTRDEQKRKGISTKKISGKARGILRALGNKMDENDGKIKGQDVITRDIAYDEAPDELIKRLKDICAEVNAEKGFNKNYSGMLEQLGHIIDKNR